ncbi:hypothetical protein PMIN03_005389 [Paraphaeosphaeria minitans]
MPYSVFVDARTEKLHGQHFVINRHQSRYLLDGLASSQSRQASHSLTDFPGPNEISRSNRCRCIDVQTTCTEALVHIMAILYCQAPASEIMTVAELFLEDIIKADLIIKIAGSPIVHQLLGVGHIIHNTSRCD